MSQLTGDHATTDGDELLLGALETLDWGDDPRHLQRGSLLVERGVAQARDRDSFTMLDQVADVGAVVFPASATTTTSVASPPPSRPAAPNPSTPPAPHSRSPRSSSATPSA